LQLNAFEAKVAGGCYIVIGGRNPECPSGKSPRRSSDGDFFCASMLKNHRRPQARPPTRRADFPDEH
jgi:hypothetical protein